MFKFAGAGVPYLVSYSVVVISLPLTGDSADFYGEASLILVGDYWFVSYLEISFL